MFNTLKNKNLEQSFLNSLTTLTKVSNIEDWFLIHEHMDTGLDHNGTLTIDCTYILSNPTYTEVAIYFSQFDNYLEISKNIELVSFSDALEGNVLFDKISKHNFCEKMKSFELSHLNDRLIHNLNEKKIIDKKHKI